MTHIKKKETKSIKKRETKSIKKKETKSIKGGSDPSSILILVIPFIIVVTFIIIILYTKVQCPIKGNLDMKAGELPKDQIVLIAAKDLKNKSIVIQSGINNTDKDMVISDDLSPDITVMSTAGEVYPDTNLMVETSENIWDTIPFSTKYINNKAWIPINDVRSCARQCLDHEWCKTIGVTKLGKCYTSAIDMTNPIESTNEPEEEEDNNISTESEEDNNTGTSLILKFGNKDRKDDNLSN